MKSNDTSIRKIARGFQITLPLEFRKEYGLDIGDYVEVSEKNGKIIIEPIEIKRKSISKQFDQIFAGQEQNRDFANRTEKEILALVRKEVKAQRKSKK